MGISSAGNQARQILVCVEVVQLQRIRRWQLKLVKNLAFLISNPATGEIAFDLLWSLRRNNGRPETKGKMEGQERVASSQQRRSSDGSNTSDRFSIGGNSTTGRIKERPILLAIFVVVFVMNAVYSQLSLHPHSSSIGRGLQVLQDFPDEEVTLKKRYAVAMFVDKSVHMYGVYSVKQQMDKLNMTADGIEQVIVMPHDFYKQHQNQSEVLHQWFDNSHIQLVDKSYIHNNLKGENLWKGVFNKLWLFNLTAYDKVIILDSDVLIRKSITHWFEYPTPCATQPEEDVTWNSGAMVISPSTKVFTKLLELLPLTKAYTGKEEQDPWNNWSTDQGFLSAFYTHEEYSKAYGRMKTMPTESSAVISRMQRPEYTYWIKFRKYIFETIHLTTAKPWKSQGPKDELTCSVLREWKASVEGIEAYTKLEPTPVMDILSVLSTAWQKPTDIH